VHITVTLPPYEVELYISIGTIPLIDSLQKTLAPAIETAAKNATDANSFAKAFMTALPQGISMKLPKDPEKNQLSFNGRNKRPLDYCDFVAFFKQVLEGANRQLAAIFGNNPTVFWQALKAATIPKKEPATV